MLAPVTFSVTELPNVTSVHVFWNQPAGGLPVDRYVVSYGQQRQSDNETDGNSTTQSQERGNTAITIDSSTTVYTPFASQQDICFNCNCLDRCSVQYISTISVCYKFNRWGRPEYSSCSTSHTHSGCREHYNNCYCGRCVWISHVAISLVIHCRWYSI